jgi:hypothetical protein
MGLRAITSPSPGHCMATRLRRLDRVRLTLPAHLRRTANIGPEIVSLIDRSFLENVKTDNFFLQIRTLVIRFHDSCRVIFSVTGRRRRIADRIFVFHYFGIGILDAAPS